MAIHLRQQAHLQSPVRRDAQIHRQIGGEGEFTSQGIAEGLQVRQVGQRPENLLQAGQQWANKQTGGSALKRLGFQGKAAVERLHVGNAVGPIQQGAEHALWIGRSKGSDVGIEQANHLSVLARHPEPLPDGPALAWWSGHVEPQFTDGFEQLADGGAVGPVHPNGEGHPFEKFFRRFDVFGARGRQCHHQFVESLQARKCVANQAEGRAAEFLHQAGDQQGCGSLTQLLVEGNRIEIAQAVVMDGADQALLKIHVVFDATTEVRVLPHT